MDKWVASVAHQLGTHQPGGADMPDLMASLVPLKELTLPQLYHILLLNGEVGP